MSCHDSVKVIVKKSIKQLLILPFNTFIHKCSCMLFLLFQKFLIALFKHTELKLSALSLSIVLPKGIILQFKLLMV